MEKQLTAREQINIELQKREAYLDYLDDHPNELNLNFLATHNLPIFVRNIMRVRAVNILEAKTPDGRKITLHVHDTSLPQELTNRAAASVIASSYHVIKALADETIELVNPRQAVEELKSPSAIRRMSKIAVSPLSKNSDAHLPDNFVPQAENLAPRNTPETAQNELANPSTSLEPASASLQAIVAKYQGKEIDAEELADTVADIARTLTMSDWLFLKSSVQDAEVQSMCNQQISAIK
jgi:hypothetical protein